jgi:tetratricopeptide (TPR) repeat protein
MITFLWCLFFVPAQGAEKYFDWSANCARAYDCIIDLRMDSADIYLRQESLSNPLNLMPNLLESHRGFLTVYVSDDPVNYIHFASEQLERQRLLKTGPGKDPYTLFSQAECQLHLALLDLRFQDMIGAVKHLKRSANLHEKNLKSFPEFLPSAKSMAILQIILGSVPEQYQWGLSLLGLKGDLDLGVETLDALCFTDFPFRREAVLTNAMLKLHVLDQPEQALTLLDNADLPSSSSLLEYYVYAHVSVYGGKAEKAHSILSRIPEGEAYLPFPFLHYLRGLSKLYQCDSDAIEDFYFFLNQTQGDSHIKAAWQKIAWAALINRDFDFYKIAMQGAEQHGKAQIPADQQALNEAKSKHRPDPELLAARLYFDGGLYKESLNILEQCSFSATEDPKDYVEWQYRMGRVFQAMDKPGESLGYLLTAIEAGWGDDAYYPYNAALQVAYLYEAEGHPEIAIAYYQKVLDSPDHEYKFSLDQKAKAALSRLN